MRDRWKDCSDEELIIRLREGEQEVMDYLMDKYKNLVRDKAKSMYILGGDTEDLIQEGMIGLFKAVRDYDFGRDAGFSTFATLCISRQMYTAVQASGRKKHMPLNTYISLSGETTHTDEQKENVPLENVLQSGQLSDPEKMLIDREISRDFGIPIVNKRVSVTPIALVGGAACKTPDDYVEIAKVLGRDEKSTDNALSRLKSKLRKVIE